MGYREKFLSAQISAAVVSGRLNVSNPMTGNLAFSGRAADVPIHYGTTNQWDSQPDLVGRKGHIYVYSDFGETEINGEKVAVPNIKIGDGNAFLIDNPFLTATVDDIINLHITDTDAHISADERDFWNEKVRCYIDSENPENVIFTTD